MKKLLVILALIPAMLFAQQTYVPDDNFEQALIDLGYDTLPLNDSVPTKNIDTVTNLKVHRWKIKDLTGIEDFKALTYLYCSANALTSLDLSGCTALTELFCVNNFLTSLNISKNTALRYLNCCDNPDLYCIQVADSAEATFEGDWDKDFHAVWSEDCGYTGVEDNKFENNDVSVSPNPASDYIEIGGVEGVNGVMIYDVLGNVVLSLGDSPFQGNDMRGVGNDIFVSSEGNVRIDVSALPKGVYFVSVGGQMYKFVKL